MARTFDVVSSRLDDPGESKSKESAKKKSNILFLFNKIDQSNWEVIADQERKIRVVYIVLTAGSGSGSGSGSADQERKIRFSLGKGIYSIHLTVLYTMVH